MTAGIVSLTKGVKTSRVMNAVAAGTTSQNSSAVDMANFEGVRFTALFGALTATQVTQLKAQQSSDNGVSDGWSDLEGSATTALADADGNKVAVLDIYRPLKRYVRCVVVRGTANAVIDGVIADQYAPRRQPTTHATSVATSKQVVSPEEGTA